MASKLHKLRSTAKARAAAKHDRICVVDGRDIEMQCQRDTSYCSQNCARADGAKD